VVTDSALYSEDNLALLQDTSMKWITRVPGTLNEVKAALAQADPEQMVP
jgi:transposase